MLLIFFLVFLRGKELFLSDYCFILFKADDLLVFFKIKVAPIKFSGT